jgi:thiamine-phosphate pyrophosphorylase
MIARLHYITQEINGLSHVENTQQACNYGIKCVQLRVKNKTEAEWFKIALETKKICKTYDACLIINDNVKIAKEVGAEGVHLGKSDMHPAKARKILGPKAIIGATADTLEEIMALKEIVNYIGLGTYRFTTTKDDISPILGLEGYRKMMYEVRAKFIEIPIIAIGGIVADDVEQILDTGIYGVAVSSAINCSLDKQATIKSFLQKVR